MKINQVSRSSNAPDVLRAILAFVMSAFPIFEVMEFGVEPFSYDVYPAKPDVGDTDNSAREINADAKNFVYEPTKGSGSQKAYAFEHLIDRAYLNDLDIGAVAPEGLVRQIRNEQLRLSKKVASDVLYDVFNGLGSDKTILGLRNLIKDVAASSGQSEYFGFTKTQIHESRIPVGITLDLDDEKLLRTFEETLIRELSGMSGTPILVMNNYLYARMATLAKQLKLYGQVTNVFGTKLDTFGPYPMAPVGTKYLPFDESDGTNNDCTSLFAVNYNEVDGLRLATNSGFYFTDFENLEEKPSGKSRLEFIGNHKIEDMRQVKRFTRIRL